MTRESNTLPKHIFHIRSFGILFALGLSMLASCYYDNEVYLYGANTVCDTTVYTYTGKIQQVIADNCFGGCHEQATGSGGIVLEGYVNLKNQAITDNTGFNKLLCVINHGADCIAMPQNRPKLSDCTITVIQKWVDNGHPEN